MREIEETRTIWLIWWRSPLIWAPRGVPTGSKAAHFALSFLSAAQTFGRRPIPNISKPPNAGYWERGGEETGCAKLRNRVNCGGFAGVIRSFRRSAGIRQVPCGSAKFRSGPFPPPSFLSAALISGQRPLPNVSKPPKCWLLGERRRCGNWRREVEETRRIWWI